MTKTLLFVGEGTGGPGASPIFRAVDKETGEIVAEIDLPNNQSGLPFTYEHDGKQYVSMFVSGGGQPARACGLRAALILHRSNQYHADFLKPSPIRGRSTSNRFASLFC